MIDDRSDGSIECTINAVSSNIDTPPSRHYMTSVHHTNWHHSVTAILATRLAQEDIKLTFRINSPAIRSQMEK